MIRSNGWPRFGVLVLTIFGLVSTETHCKLETDTHIFLLPDAYRGPVVIVYGVPQGIEVPLDQGRKRIYRINRTGILAVQEPHPPDGWYDLKFFYDRAGEPHELGQGKGGKELQVLHFVDGRTAMVDAEPIECTWTAFIVGVPGESENWIHIREQAVESAAKRFCAPRPDDKLRGTRNRDDAS